MIINSSRRYIRLLPAVFAVCLLLSCGAIEVSKVYNRGAVASGSPLASQIGVQVMKQGGNAFDAAVAVGFALAVVHPEAGNIGGGGFALIRNGETGQVRALDFRETAPATATETMFLDSDSNVIEDASLIGALSAGVPGTVAGLHELWKKYGSLPWNDLVSIAADLADSGFVLDQYLAGSLVDHRDDLTIYSETAEVFYPNGQTPKAGDRLTLRNLAQSLYAIAADGPDAFYKGHIATLIDSTMKLRGGLITLEDLAGYKPLWREPNRVEFDGYEIYSMPPPSSGGITTAQILKLIEPFDFSPYTPESPEYMHLFAETAKLAFADRSRHLGDPAFYNVPATLLAESYLETRRDLIDIDHATPSAEIIPGSPPVSESESTTHYSICDDKGNMVAITYTLNQSYGSYLVVGGAGFLLNDEMDDFSIKPGVPNTYGLIGGEANKIEPGKRMLSSMAPTLVTKDNKPFLALGTAGGSKIITQVAQALIEIIRFDLTPGQAVSRPHFHHQWLPDLFYLEEGKFDINIKQALIRYGYTIKERTPYGDLELIQIQESGKMLPAADMRRNGSAAGY